MVDRADHHRSVRIALLEGDDDFLADAGQAVEAPALAGDVVRHAHPDRGLVVALALAVPMELDLHAAVFIGVDFFPGRAGDDRRLQPVQDRLRRIQRRAEHHVVGHAGEGVVVGLLAARSAGDLDRA